MHVSQLYDADEAQCDVHMSQQHPPCAGAESTRRLRGREGASMKTRCAKTGGCWWANERVVAASTCCVPLHHDPGGASQAMCSAVPVVSRSPFPSWVGLWRAALVQSDDLARIFRRALSIGLVWFERGAGQLFL